MAQAVAQPGSGEGKRSTRFRFLDQWGNVSIELDRSFFIDE